jgi:hypothetical protein
MYLASERQVVNGVGLGDLEGFKIKKAFKRMIKIKKSSFKLKNIMGAVGSATMFTATSGLSTLAPKLTGAHSKLSRIVGIGATAVAAVAGAVVAAPMIGGALGIGGAAATGTGLTATAATATAATGWTVGGVLSAIGTGLSVFSGGKGISPQAQYPPGYEPTATQYNTPAPQEYYGPNTPVGEQLSQTVYPTMPDASNQTNYNPASLDTQLQSPYTPLADDSLQIDSKTGQLMLPQQASMIPDLSMTTWLAIGGATLAGWYFMSGSKSNN